MKQTIDTPIAASRVTRDPKVVLRYLLEEESDRLGWMKCVLIDHASGILERTSGCSEEESMGLTTAALQTLLNTKEVLEGNYSICTMSSWETEEV